MSHGFVIAILGAESTGKTTLARDLAQALSRRSGLATTWVPEHLRAWCDAQGRTPRADEQVAIARAQHAAIDAAASAFRIVVADTTAAMTATYSRLLFGDGSLDDAARRWHAPLHATLVTALDLPWVADGLQRDGPHVRGPVDAALTAWLDREALPWERISGSGPQRLDRALTSVWPALAAFLAPASVSSPSTTQADGPAGR